MTTQQDSVDVERADLAAKIATLRSEMTDAPRREWYPVHREYLAAILDAAALSLPITQRDEQGESTPTSDSSVYKHTFYGILNAQGDFWTPLAFESEKAATDHIIRFGGGAHTEKAQQCLSTHTIVPVRINLTAIRRLSIEQGDQDGGAE